MQRASRTDGWRRRRLLFPLAGIGILGLALLVAVARSGRSTVIVSNRTGAPIRQLEIAACGQSRRFASISDRESVQLELSPTGTGGQITLSAGEVVIWRGEYLVPDEGYHVSLRLQRDGSVDSSTTLSTWQRLFQPLLNRSL